MPQVRRELLLLFVLTFTVACSDSPVTNEPAANVASVDVVKVSAPDVQLTPGGSVEVLVPIKITEGYHVNANPPSFPYLKATQLEVESAHGISVESITYPEALTRKFSFSKEPLAVYEGETALKVRLKAEPSAADKHNLSAKLRVQACDDKVCYAPGTLDLIIPVTVK